MMKKFIFTCIAVLMLVQSCAYVDVKIGIIGAMDVEVKLLKENAVITRKTVKAGMEFCEGKLGDNDVVIVKCGMGKVNSGICAQMLIDLFNVSHIINSGVAGALNDSLNIGDIVVATDVVQHDYDVTHIGFKAGEIPYTGKYAFETDRTLRYEAVKAVHAVAPETQVVEGRICTGDQFLSEREKFNRIISIFGGNCVEMEAGAIAQVCYLNNVPFVIIRAISDKIGTSVEDYKKFEASTAERCASITKYMAENFKTKGDN